MALSVRKRGVKERVDDLQRQQLADEAGAEGHHVRVVVLARQAGGHRVGQQGAADAVHLVRRDGNFFLDRGALAPQLPVYS